MKIRPVRSFWEYKAVEEIQKAAWAAGDEIAVPDHMLMVVQHYGGVLLIAVEEPDRPIGFVFGIVARNRRGRVFHHSHIMGVLPEYQNRDVGRRLKLAQREAVLAQQLDLITWTFDPLQSRNAYLNFAKLGVICRTYLRDYYGEMTDGLNAGLASDRFEVFWHLRQQRVVDRLTAGGNELRPRLGSLLEARIPILNPTDDPRRPAGNLVSRPAGPVLIQIPADIQAVKTADVGAAIGWRDQTRALFEEAFAAGLTAVDYIWEGPFGWYLLR